MMKNPPIELLPDKVTISEQGKAASRKWHAGDKPFVQFMVDAEKCSNSPPCPENSEEIEEVGAVQEDADDLAEEWKSTAEKSSQLIKVGDQMSLDIGSRLEFEAPSGANAFIIRSTTRVNLNEGPHFYETHWEVFQDDNY